MGKTIWKSIGEWPYFLSNILMGIKVVFLQNCHLLLSLLKHRGVGVFLKKKKGKKKREIQTEEAP